MTLLLRDSIDASQIPADTPVVAGYGDGAYQWSSADWARFPTALALSIVVSAQDQGDILDVERGDATPSDCPGWADRFARPGRRLPTIYCDRNTIAAVRGAMAGRPFDWWAATLDGTMDVAGAVAVQYVDVGPYDESVILDPAWVGGDPVALDGLDPTDPTVNRLLVQVQALHDTWTTNSADPTQPTALDRFETLYNAALDVQQRVQALQVPTTGALTATQAQQLADIAAAAARIEAALKGA